MTGMRGGQPFDKLSDTLRCVGAIETLDPVGGAMMKVKVVRTRLTDY